MTDAWDTGARARLDFADLIDGLTDEQLAAESWCEGWTILNLAGHVVSFVEMSLPQIRSSIAKSGDDVDKAWMANALKYSEQGADQIVKKLRANARKRFPIKSAPAEDIAGDVAVHTQDVRRSLGLNGDLDPDVLLMALQMCTSHPQSDLFVPPEDIAGLRLEATDTDWSFGSGDLVSGTGEAILMAINRRDTHSELSGDGITKLPR